MAVRRKLAVPLAQKDAEEVVRNLSVMPVVPIDTDMILAAVLRTRREHFSFRDALIFEAALAGGAKSLLSEDMQHGRVIDGMTIENPFV